MNAQTTVKVAPSHETHEIVLTDDSLRLAAHKAIDRADWRMVDGATKLMRLYEAVETQESRVRALMQRYR